MATIARMHVELIARGDRYRRDIEKSRTTTEKLRHELTKTRSVVGLMAGAAGFGLAARKVFELGSAAEETASKFSTVFGQSTDEVQRFIDNFATIAGLSQTQAREVTATTGSIVQGMGFAREASARFSQQVVQLAGDLSSFNNIPIEETSLAIQAALTGEREQLKRLGIVLREADVQQRALAISGGDAEVAALDQTRATASLQLITERAGVAVGDLSRTQNSAANRARALKAELRTMAETMSQLLLPAFTFVFEKLIAFIGGMKIWIAEIKLGWATLQFWKERLIGTAESMLQAEVRMEQMVLDLVHVKNEVANLSAGLGGGGAGGGTQGGTLTGGTNSAAEAAAQYIVRLEELAARVLSAAANTFRLQLSTDGTTASVHQLTPAIITVTNFMDLYAAALKRAREESEKLNRTQQQFSAVTGALGFLSGLPGLGFLSGPLGFLSGGVSSFFGLEGAFGGGRAHGGPVSGGTAYMVGERGPELFVPQQSGAVIPNGGLSLNVSMSKPRGPREAARDSEWLRELAWSIRELEGNGFRAATP